MRPSASLCTALLSLACGAQPAPSQVLRPADLNTHLWGLVPVLGGWGQALQSLSDSEKQEEGVSLHGGMDETSLLLYLRPELVSPDYQSAPVVTGHSLEESFAVAKAADWPGYLGSPRLATATLGERIWRSFAAAATDHALRVLDGAHPTQFPRYADLLARNPLYQQWINAATAHEQELEGKQREWLGRRPR